PAPDCSSPARRSSDLKRDRTPREVVAQALDYAAWVERLEADEIAAIYQRFKPQGNLAADFQARFGVPLDIESLNQSHQIVIVAADRKSTRLNSSHVTI